MDRILTPVIPVLDGLGSTAGGLTDPPEDRLEGELPGWCQGVALLPIIFDEGIVTFFTVKIYNTLQRALLAWTY